VILLKHLGLLLVDTVRCGIATRRLALVVLVLLGLAALLLGLAAQVAVPVIVYPFA
jgi:hypothetical protein